MLNLLQIEFHKMRYNRATKIFLIIYFCLFFSITLFSSIRFNLGEINFQLAEQGIFNFPYIWHFNTYFAAILKIFLALVVISMISTEYSNQTLKQNLIDGLSKKEFILSKFYMIIALSLASTILIFLVSLGLGLIFSDFNEINIIFSEMGYLGTYFLKLVAFFSFCLFLGVWIKRSAFVIGALFVWWVAEGIIKGILTFRKQKYGIKDQISQFFPLEAMNNLIKEPLTKLGIVKSSIGVVNDVNIYWYQILIALIWTFIFVWGAYFLIKKRDL